MSPSSVLVWLPLAIQNAPQVAPETMLAFIAAESGGNPLAIHDNATGESFTPTTKAAAVTLARRLMAERHSFDAGLTQIDVENFDKLGVTVETVFDPASSIRAAQKLMVADYLACLKERLVSAALRCMASKYNTGDGLKGERNGYVARLWKAAAQIVPAIGGASLPSTNQPETDPSDPEPAPYDVWAHQEWADRQTPRRAPPVEPPTPQPTAKETPAVTDTDTFKARAVRAFVLALVLTIIVAMPAFAQIAGGGAGWLQGLWQTFLQNIAPGLGIAAIAVVGILAMGARLGLIIVCGIVIGIYIVNHADAIYGLIAVG